MRSFNSFYFSFFFFGVCFSIWFSQLFVILPSYRWRRGLEEGGKRGGGLVRCAPGY